MPLPLQFVERIHQRLMVRYGSAWVSKWAGVDQAAIQADWAEQLHGMSPAQIKAALDALPDDFPPTCTAFRKLGISNAPYAEETQEMLRLQAERGKPPTAEQLEALRQRAKDMKANMALRLVDAA
jgi:hypothetical protein